MTTASIKVAVLPATLLTLALLAVPNAALAAGKCRNAGLMPATHNLKKVEAATRCLINVERRQRGRPYVRTSRPLQRVARRFSVRMVDDGFFSHVSPRGTTLRSRVRRTSYLRGARGWSLAENLGWGSGRSATPRRTVNNWMNSASHRANVLDGRLRHVGVGVAFGSPSGTHSRPAATYTADFGRLGRSRR